MALFLEFNLKQQSYAVAIGSVREINRMSTISPVPQAPAYIAGVINLRGKVIPVLDLRRRFGFDEASATRETCIIVIEGDGRQAGMIVDSVSGVVDLTADQIEPPPELGGRSSESGFVIGMGKTDTRVVVLIDPAKLMARDLATTELSQAA